MTACTIDQDPFFHTVILAQNSFHVKESAQLTAPDPCSERFHRISTNRSGFRAYNLDIYRKELKLMKRNHFTKTVLIFTAVLILLSLAFPALAENSTPAGSALYKLRSAERGRSGTENGGAETSAAPNKDDGRSWNVLDTDEENSDSYYERYCGTGKNSQSGCRNMNSRRQGCRGYGRFTDAEDGRGCQNCPYLD